MFGPYVRLTIIILSNVVQFITYMLWMGITLPVKVVSPELYWTIDGHLSRLNHAVVASWLWLSGYTVAETGDDIRNYQQDGCLFLVNHQSLIDVPFIMSSSLDKPQASTSVYWALAHKFRLSHFGLICWVRKDIFIRTDRAQEKRDRDNRELTEKLLDTAQSNPRKKWIFLFPEGGLLSKKREKSKAYARTNGFPILHNISLPRAGAMATILNTIGPRTKGSHRKVKWVVDMTIIYPEGDPVTPADLIKISSKEKRVLIHYRVHPADSLPESLDDLTRWLHKDFQMRDVMLGNLYNRNQQGEGCRPQAGDGGADLSTRSFTDKPMTCDDRKTRLIQPNLGIMILAYVVMGATLCLLCKLIFIVL